MCAYNRRREYGKDKTSLPVCLAEYASASLAAGVHQLRPKRLRNGQQAL
jgi:hypothetical protein